MNRLLSLCSGYGGLDLAAETILGAVTVAHAETDPAASRVLAARWPNVTNLGDITTNGWDDIHADIITAGYPCQPFSHAGQRRGEADERHLWPHVAAAVRRIRPRLVVLENVAGHRSLGFGRVLADLAALGYVGSWASLRAADVGAPHGRERVFILAVADAECGGRAGRPHQPQRQAEGRTAARGTGADLAADAQTVGREGLGLAGRMAQEQPRTGRDVSAAADTRGGSLARAGAAGNGLRVPAEHGHRPAADADFAGPQGREPAAGRDVPTRGAAADTSGDGRDEGWPEPARLIGGSDAAECGARDWGQYGPAIRRWEHVLGRVAPAPTEPGPRGGQRLSPRFVEWMLGLADGWVTGVPGITRNQQLRMLGNGVVPQQAAAALTRLLQLQAAA